MGAVLLVIGRQSGPTLRQRIRRMTDRSPHRGKASFFAVDGIEMAVQSLGWDASMARGKFAVVGFHGFVGNWAELRKSHGLQIEKGAGDAECVAAAFEVMGDEIVGLLRGEFAAIIHDLRNNRVLAFRDVAGCRPLYLWNLGGLCVVASEVRQVVAGSDRSAEPNPRALANYLLFDLDAGTDTLVAGVECVMPGEIYDFGLERSGFSLHRREYWRLEDSMPGGGMDEAEWLDELQRRIQRAVRRWLPEHPSALTLSGGLDSSALWAEIVALRGEGFSKASLVRPISEYYPGFPCDERELIELTLGRTGDQGIAIDGTRETFSRLRPLLLRQLDTVPFATSYSLPFTAETARNDGRMTLLTGHLGDHLFDIRLPGFRGRMTRVLRVMLNTTLGRRRAIDAYLGLRKLVRGSRQAKSFDPVREDWFPGLIAGGWDRSLTAASPRQVVADRLARERTGWSLPSWEQLCSGFGVEVRHPFADPDLIAFAAAVPRSLLDSDLTKPALRVVYRNRLPERIINRRNKAAFDCLVENDHPSLANDLPIADWYLVRSGVVDPVALDSLLDAANNDLRARNRALEVETAELYAQSLIG